MLDLETPRTYIEPEQAEEYMARPDFMPVAKYCTLVPQEMTEIGSIVVGREEKTDANGITIRTGGRCVERIIVRDVSEH